MKVLQKDGNKVKKHLYSFAILIISIYLYASAFSISTVYGSTTLAMITLLFSFCLVILAEGTIKIYAHRFIFYLLLLPVILIRNHHLRTGDYYIEIVFIVMLTIWLICSNVSWHNWFQRLIEIMGLIFAITTIIFYLFPDLYSAYTIKIFPNNSYQLLRNYSKGYMYGLTKSSAFNSAFILYGLAVYIFKLTDNNTHSTRAMKYLVILIYVVAIFLTVKRSAILFGIFSLYLTYMMTSNTKNKLFRTVFLLLLSIAVFVIVAQFIPDISTAFDKTMSQGWAGDISNGRFERAKLTFCIFKEYPLLGIGWGGINEISSYQLMDDIIMTSSHNVYLQLMAETGVIGFSIFFYFFIFNLKRAYYVIKNGLLTDRVSSKFSFFFQIFFLLYCFVGNPLYDSVYFIVYFLVSSYSLVESRKHKNG